MSKLLFIDSQHDGTVGDNLRSAIRRHVMLDHVKRFSVTSKRPINSRPTNKRATHCHEDANESRLAVSQTDTGVVSRSAVLETDRCLFFRLVTAIPMEIHSPLTEREHLHRGFFDAHSPHPVQGRTSLSNALIHWFGQNNAAMKEATLALLLLQAATDTKDDSVLVESRKHYGKALHLVRRSMATMSLNAGDAGIVYAVDALYAYSSTLPESAGNTSLRWQQHTRGMTAIVAWHGIDVVATPTGVLFMGHLHVSVMDAIISRREFVFGRPEWLTRMNSQQPSRFKRLILVACRIPDQLVSIDNCSALPEDSDLRNRGAMAAFRVLGSIQLDFQNWLLDWYHSSFGQQPYTICSLRDTYHTCPSMIAEALANQPHVYSFPSLAAVIGHIFYWTLLLITRQALHAAASLSFANDEQLLSMLALRTSKCARSILQSIPYLVNNLEMPHAGTGKMKVCCGPLSWARQWFLSTGNADDGRRCQEIVEYYGETGNQVELICLTRAMAVWLEFCLD